MTIKVVTDSSADIPPQLLKELGISVVPLYIRFGKDIYKDKVDLSNEQFYDKLVNSGIFPSTIQPSPMDFKQVYDELAKDADGIVSVHLSAEFSGTYQSALKARGMMETSCPVEVINTKSMTIGQGMVCLEAARAAKKGANLEETVKAANDAIPEVHFFVMFDTLKFLAMGGRIGHAKSLMGTMLNIKPIVAMKDGIVVPAAKARSFSKGIEMQYNFISDAVAQGDKCKEIAILHNTNQKVANELVDRTAEIFPREKIITGQIGPILSTHGGPNAIVVCIRGNITKSQIG